MMTYDARDGYVVLFGGVNTGTDPEATWTFVHGTWIHLGSAGGPGFLEGASFVGDARAGYAVLFGGPTVWQSNETGAFSNGTWSAFQPTVSPPPRSFAPMAYDPHGGYLVRFGGFNDDGDTFFSDTGHVGVRARELEPSCLKLRARMP